MVVDKRRCQTFSHKAHGASNAHWPTRGARERTAHLRACLRRRARRLPDTVIPFVMIHEHRDAYCCWTHFVYEGLIGESDNYLLHVDHHDDYEIGLYDGDQTCSSAACSKPPKPLLATSRDSRASSSTNSLFPTRCGVHPARPKTKLLGGE